MIQPARNSECLVYKDYSRHLYYRQKLFSRVDEFINYSSLLLLLTNNFKEKGRKEGLLFTDGHGIVMFWL